MTKQMLKLEMTEHAKQLKARREKTKRFKLPMTEEAKILKMRREKRRPKWRGKPEDNPYLSEKKRKKLKLEAISQQMIAEIKARLAENS